MLFDPDLVNSASALQAALLSGGHRRLVVYDMHGLQGEPMPHVICKLAHEPPQRSGLRIVMLAGHLIPTPEALRILLRGWLTSAVKRGERYEVQGHFGARRFTAEWKLLTFTGLYNASVGVGVIRLMLGQVG